MALGNFKGAYRVEIRKLLKLIVVFISRETALTFRLQSGSFLSSTSFLFTAVSLKFFKKIQDYFPTFLLHCQIGLQMLKFLSDRNRDSSKNKEKNCSKMYNLTIKKN